MTIRARGLATLFLLLGAAVRAPAQRPDSAMTGAWTGTARLTADWLASRALAVRIVIQEDGAVTGTVGDATLAGGHLVASRGIVERALRIGRQYLIEGRLTGPVIAAEGQTRARVRIGVDWSAGTWVGELQTSGSYDGPPQGQVISGTGLVLRRASGSASAAPRAQAARVGT